MTEPFRFPEGQLAYSGEDLVKLCQELPAEATNYLIREDFEKWLSYIGKNDLAKYAEQSRQASVSDEEKLKQFIASCQGIKTKIVKKQAKKSQESVSSTNKIIQNLKSFLFGNRRKAQEQKLSTE